VRTSRTAVATVAATALLGLGVAACGTNSNGSSSAASSAAPAPATSVAAAAPSSAAASAPAGSAPAPASSAAVSAVASVAAPACGTGTLSAQGSTFQLNMETQWSKDFGSVCSGAQVNYQGTGSGAGITAIGNGTADLAGSDVTMTAAQQTAANTACGSTAITLPVTAGGVAIVYNLKGVTSLNLSATTLAGIFSGKIVKWNDPAIAADNSGTALPSTPISVFYRNDASGTTQVYTGFLQAVAGSAWTEGSSKTVTFFSSAQGAKGSAGVAAGVSQTSGGITYDEESYAKGQNLPVANVKGSGSTFIAPSTATVSQSIGDGFAVTGTGNDLAGALDFTKMTGYPISTVSYAIACTKYKDAAKGSLVKSYLFYAVTKGQAAADGLGFAALPSSLVTKDEASISAIS
jgi:phosphate transport system substrate-binding protein